MHAYLGGAAWQREISVPQRLQGEDEIMTYSENSRSTIQELLYFGVKSPGETSSSINIKNF